jgi:hypothetical protein
LSQLAIDLRNELTRVHACELVASTLELSSRIAVLAECTECAGKRDSRLAEICQ